MEKELEKAVSALREGGVVLYPTETFYAIGCAAQCEGAIRRVFALKRRPAGMPLPLILGSPEQLGMAADVPGELADDVHALARLWPAPLTLLLPASRSLPPLLTAGSGRIAVRVSAHPVAQALAIQGGTPIISTSANISGKQAVTAARSLDQELVQALLPADCILDLPPAPAGGAPSTIAEPLGGGRLRVLRPGAFDLQPLARLGFTIVQERT